MIPLLLAGLSLAGSAVGAIGSAVENAKARKITDQQIAKNDAMFNQDYYSDYTQRADVQSAFARQREMMKENSNRNRNTSAVMGSTPEMAVASQKADNEVLGETVNAVAGQGANFKQHAKDVYQMNDNALAGQKAGDFRQQAQEFSNFGSNAANLAIQSVAGSVSDLESFDKSKLKQGGLNTNVVNGITNYE